MIVVQDALRQDILANEVLGNDTATFNGILSGTKVALFKAMPALTHSTKLTDLTEADYTGYAKKAVTWNPAWQDTDGAFVLTGNLMQFMETDLLKSQDIAGWGLVDATGAVLLESELFPAPMPLQSVLDAVLVAPQVRIPTDGNWGSGIVAGD